MKITIPKALKGFTIRQKDKKSNTFYVTSEKNPDQKYMVVSDGSGLFFCQCGDFFGRKLTGLINGGTELCKHGQFVKEVLEFVNPAALDHAEKANKHSRVITGAVSKTVW